MNALECMTEEEQINFRHSDLQDDIFLSSKVEIIDIRTDPKKIKKKEIEIEICERREMIFLFHV